MSTHIGWNRDGWADFEEHGNAAMLAQFWNNAGNGPLSSYLMDSPVG